MCVHMLRAIHICRFGFHKSYFCCCPVFRCFFTVAVFIFTFLQHSPWLDVVVNMSHSSYLLLYNSCSPPFSCRLTPAYLSLPHHPFIRNAHSNKLHIRKYVSFTIHSSVCVSELCALYAIYALNAYMCIAYSGDDKKWCMPGRALSVIHPIHSRAH